MQPVRREEPHFDLWAEVVPEALGAAATAGRVPANAPVQDAFSAASQSLPPAIWNVLPSCPPLPLARLASPLRGCW